MPIDDTEIGNAVMSLFPSKRYAPRRSEEVNCPTPPQAENENKDGK